MIKTEALSKQFGHLTALESLDLDIAQGEFFAFLGPNGAGKTTTIRMLTGLLKPSGGQVHVAGFDIQKSPTEAKRLISYVPDFPFLYDKLTPREFLRFVGELYEMEREAITRLTGSLFEQFHLAEYHNELIENLESWHPAAGRHQRGSVARPPGAHHRLAHGGARPDACPDRQGRVQGAQPQGMHDLPFHPHALRRGGDGRPASESSTTGG